MAIAVTAALLAAAVAVIRSSWPCRDLVSVRRHRWARRALGRVVAR